MRGLVINRFDIDLILIERPAGDGIRIAGNFIGTDVTGSVAAGGERGIFIGAGSNHVIGGSVALDRNVISGNSTQGINIVPNPLDVSEPGRITIQGNYIGTDATGEATVAGNTAPGQEGIRSTNSHGPVVVGGAGPGEGDVISGNPSPAIELFFVPAPEIVGNMIGTDRTGRTALPNSFGIETQSVTDALIADNVISGNSGPGIHLRGDEGTVVRSNKVGVDVVGLERTQRPGRHRAHLDERGARRRDDRGRTQHHLGNGQSGIHFRNDPTRNAIQGNYIGVGAEAALSETPTGGSSAAGCRALPD